MVYNSEIMTETRIVTDRISVPELKVLAHEFYGDTIKAVVDVRQEIMGAGGEFHSEIEKVLIEKHASQREDTWGINLLLDTTGDDFIEFDSMINLKPAYGNRTRSVGDSAIQARIKEIVGKRVVMP